MKQSSQSNQQIKEVKRERLAFGCSGKLLNKHRAFPVVENNLKQEDLEVLSVKLGEEIAVVVIDEILSKQSPNIRAIVGK